ncbi:MAG: transglycosylase domain-containing protein [Burkholderiaceae bacterium]|nr:transglycosylase domain-containing protein [Burkholderiaceae bacterium]
MKRATTSAWRFLALLVVCALALQVAFALRIALMAIVDPQSTSFQRSEIWRLLTEQHHVRWSQDWVGNAQISPNLKRAVIASEDAGFAEHSGIEWDALEKAWERNQKAEARVSKINERLEKQALKSPAAADVKKPLREPKVVGGSTITQQLAKNLFLAGERSLPRKAQEFVITFMLEAMLNKQRILEIYLNNVEWGEGVFGAEAAARHYFHGPAAQLSPTAAARLAVMLPAPKRFEKRPDSPYVMSRAATVVARMGAVEVP